MQNTSRQEHKFPLVGIIQEDLNPLGKTSTGMHMLESFILILVNGDVSGGQSETVSQQGSATDVFRVVFLNPWVLTDSPHFCSIPAPNTPELRLGMGLLETRFDQKHKLSSGPCGLCKETLVYSVTVQVVLTASRFLFHAFAASTHLIQLFQSMKQLDEPLD